LNHFYKDSLCWRVTQGTAWRDAYEQGSARLEGCEREDKRFLSRRD